VLTWRILACNIAYWRCSNVESRETDSMWIRKHDFSRTLRVLDNDYDDRIRRSSDRDCSPSLPTRCKTGEWGARRGREISSADLGGPLPHRGRERALTFAIIRTELSIEKRTGRYGAGYSRIFRMLLDWKDWFLESIFVMGKISLKAFLLAKFS